MYIRLYPKEKPNNMQQIIKEYNDIVEYIFKFHSLSNILYNNSNMDKNKIPGFIYNDYADKKEIVNAINNLIYSLHIIKNNMKYEPKYLKTDIKTIHTFHDKAEKLMKQLNDSN